LIKKNCMLNKNSVNQEKTVNLVYIPLLDTPHNKKAYIQTGSSSHLQRKFTGASPIIWSRLP